MMKKIIPILLISTIVLGLFTGCSQKTQQKPVPKKYNFFEPSIEMKLDKAAYIALEALLLNVDRSRYKEILVTKFSSQDSFLRFERHMSEEIEEQLMSKGFKVENLQHVNFFQIKKYAKMDQNNQLALNIKYAILPNDRGTLLSTFLMNPRNQKLIAREQVMIDVSPCELLHGFAQDCNNKFTYETPKKTEAKVEPKKVRRKVGLVDANCIGECEKEMEKKIEEKVPPKIDRTKKPVMEPKIEEHIFKDYQ